MIKKKKPDFKANPITEKTLADIEKEQMQERWEKMKSQNHTVNPYRY